MIQDTLHPTLLPFSPNGFTAPLAFMDQEFGGCGNLHPGLAQHYLLRPFPQSVQSRLAGRAALVPMLDLSRFRVDAVIDWIDIVVTTEDDQQEVNVNRWIAAATGQSLSATRVSSEDDASRRVFAIRVQEPTARTLELVVAKIDAHPRLTCSGRISGIEVSVDWYARSRQDLDGLVIADLLARHLLPAEDVWKGTRGTPRFYGRKGRRRNGSMTDTPPILAHSLPGVHDTPIVYVGVELEPDPSLMRTLDRSMHTQPAADGTVYYGAKEGAEMIRIMHKVVDRQNRVTRQRKDLAPGERRARIEVTLTGNALERAGLTHLRDLAGGGFKRLRTRYFSFWLPTVPYHAGRAATVSDVLKGLWSRLEIAIFRRSGVYGLDAYQDARRERARRARKDLVLAGAPKRERDRLATGAHGFNVDFEEMNRRTRDALIRLGREWLGFMSQGS